MIDEHRSTIDTSINDLNVVEGTPLNNKYIALVCARNIQSKLNRCLDSIKHQTLKNQDIDFGIVFIDDDSDDKTFQIAYEMITNNFNDYIIVSNKIRKYLPRNIYNAVNYLCTNPESIIIQIDGDDLLEHSTDVFKELDLAYVDDTVITFGSHHRITHGTKLLEYFTPHDLTNLLHVNKCSFWDHLKTYKKFTFDLITVDLLQEIGSDLWIMRGEDAVIQPTIMIHYTGRVKYIQAILYIHDISNESGDAKYDNIYNSFKVKSNMKVHWKTLLTENFDSYEDAVAYFDRGNSYEDLEHDHYVRQRKDKMLKLKVDRNLKLDNERKRIRGEKSD